VQIDTDRDAVDGVVRDLGDVATRWLDRLATSQREDLGWEGLEVERARVERVLLEVRDDARVEDSLVPRAVGPGGKNFVETMLRLAAERDELRVVADQIGSPTYTGDLAQAIYRLLAGAERSGSYGLYHFSNLGETSWHGFAEEITAQARQLGEQLQVTRVVPIATSDYPLPAPRPAYSVFSKAKYLAATAATIPAWRESLAFYMRERVTSDQ
jgi:dTDP-4-dehydrorhamnose reductase